MALIAADRPGYERVLGERPQWTAAQMLGVKDAEQDLYAKHDRAGKLGIEARCDAANRLCPIRGA